MKGDCVGNADGEGAEEALQDGDAVLHRWEDGDAVVYLLQRRQHRLMQGLRLCEWEAKAWVLWMLTSHLFPSAQCLALTSTSSV